MFQSNHPTRRRRLAVQVTLTLLLLSLMALIIAIALFYNHNGLPQATSAPRPTSRPIPDTPSPVGTSTPAATIAFQSVALGFSLEYPKGWRRKEETLEVIFSPSADGLDPHNLRDAALWVGIPPTDTYDPSELASNILSDLPQVELLSQGIVTIGGQNWNSLQLRFNDEKLGGPVAATLAVTNKAQVGYFLMVIAPAKEWPTLQPTFQAMVNSFEFNVEAILLPTDATPPPTPTPTATPVIYVIEPGDTIGAIAARYGVDVELLAETNDIRTTDMLRVGQELIIPIE